MHITHGLIGCLLQFHSNVSAVCNLSIHITYQHTKILKLFIEPIYLHLKFVQLCSAIRHIAMLCPDAVRNMFHLIFHLTGSGHHLIRYVFQNIRRFPDILGCLGRNLQNFFQIDHHTVESACQSSYFILPLHYDLMCKVFRLHRLSQPFDRQHDPGRSDADDQDTEQLRNRHCDNKVSDHSAHIGIQYVFIHRDRQKPVTRLNISREDLPLHAVIVLHGNLFMTSGRKRILQRTVRIALQIPDGYRFIIYITVIAVRMHHKAHILIQQHSIAVIRHCTLIHGMYDPVYENILGQDTLQLCVDGNLTGDGDDHSPGIGVFVRRRIVDPVLFDCLHIPLPLREVNPGLRLISARRRHPVILTDVIDII